MEREISTSKRGKSYVESLRILTASEPTLYMHVVCNHSHHHSPTSLLIPRYAAPSLATLLQPVLYATVISGTF